MKIRKEIMRKKTSAFVLNFTLIELLVVIAIIAVLAGILLPALNSARDKGISISCMNTIRTLGFAAVQYAGTYNEYWVPYNRATGYNRWKSLGIDYAYMQPNYYWEADKRPLSQFFADVKAADLAMEFEFEHTVLESQAGSDVYRKRFREYMQGAISSGVYGSQPLAYYHGTNALVLLSQSQSAVDRELYHEFCQFVLNNPLRAENTGK